MTGEIAEYFGDLLLRYENAGVIRSLIQLIPLNIGSAGDVLLASRIKQIREDRAREFFDELAKDGSILTPAVIESEDFIHCFTITSKAALNTRRREKIRLFARLLASSVSKPHPRDTDDYEQMLAILDDLTYSEWSALAILDRYSTTSTNSGENALQWSQRFWPNFQDDTERELGIPKSEFTAFMNPISRTGLYEQIVGAYWRYDGGVGMLTPRFHRLKSFVSNDKT